MCYDLWGHGASCHAHEYALSDRDAKRKLQNMSRDVEVHGNLVSKDLLANRYFIGQLL